MRETLKDLTDDPQIEVKPVRKRYVSLGYNMFFQLAVIAVNKCADQSMDGRRHMQCPLGNKLPSGGLSSDVSSFRAVALVRLI